jgi:hypothetical protein
MSSPIYYGCMKKYLSHLTAAKVWNIPCIETVLGHKITEADPTHITVSVHDARVPNNRRKVHSCELALPANSVVMRNGRMVSSPELMFLELACELSIHRLILLGLQLCSHPPGSPSMAITTKQKLNMFLAKTKGHRGRRKAVRAMRFVKNGSASVMESLVYMILGLPHALGGYGLNDAVFNYEVKLKSAAQARLKQNRCFVDLYYKRAKLAVEYESFTYHNTPSELGKDSIRSTILQRQGIAVMHLSTIQLYDQDACRDFAYTLADRIGKRMQIRTKRFDEMHALLRALLPDRNPASESLMGDYSRERKDVYG